MKMKTTCNGLTLSYEDYGQGTTILLLHGFPLSGAMWQPQISALKTDFRLIIPDLRGFGQSEVPIGPYLMETFAADLVALIDSLGLEQVILGGLSMGGYIALAFLRYYPARVQALILADTRATPDTAEIKANREANAQLAELHGPSTIVPKMLPGLLSPKASPEMQAQISQLIMENKPQGIAGALRGMALRPDSSDLLAKIKVPTLVLVGAEDSLSPPAELKHLQQAIPGSELVIIPAAGHLANVENPTAFNAALQAFLLRF